LTSRREGGLCPVKRETRRMKCGYLGQENAPKGKGGRKARRRGPKRIMRQKE